MKRSSSRWGKKAIRFFGISLVCLILVAAAIPLWFPWVLRPVLAAQGVHYSAYERLGYSQFLLRNVQYSSGETIFQVKEVKFLLPASLIWQRWVKKPEAQKNTLVATDWSLKIAKKSSVPRHPVPVYEGVMKTKAVLNSLRGWISRAVLQNGAIESDQTRVVIDSAVWSNGTLVAGIEFSAAQQRSPTRLLESKVNLVLGPDFPWKADFLNDHLQLRGNFAIDRQISNGIQIHGSLFWRTNEVKMNALFTPGKTLPAEADVEGPSLLLPSELTGARDYKDMDGSISAHWKNDAFLINLDFKTEPRNQTNVNFPVLHAAIHASGNTNWIQIDEAEATTPWLMARLDPKVRFDFTGKMLTDFATFKLSSDLQKQPWLPLTGRLEGEALIKKSATAYPEVFFKLAGRSLTGYSVKVEEARVEGQLLWPLLAIDALDLRMDRGARIQATGDFDVEKKCFSNGMLQVEEPSSGPWIPSGFAYSNLTATTEINGFWKSPTLSGTLKAANLTTPYLRPLALKSTWHGNDFQIEISPEKDTRLLLKGSAQLATAAQQIELSALTLEQDGRKLSLAHPASIMLRHEAKDWEVQIEGFQWSDTNRDFSLAANIRWPEKGHILSTATNIDLSIFQPFIKETVPPVVFSKVSFESSWTNGPASFSLQAESHLATETNSEWPPFSVQLSLTGNASGISISNLVVSSQARPVVNGSGFLPVTLWPEQGKSGFHIETNGSFQAELATTPNPRFWSQFSALGPVQITEPSAHLSVSGNLSSPQGHLEFGIRQAKVHLRPNLPELSIQDIQARVNLSQQGISLQQLHFLAEGQPITVNATLPWPAKFEKWRQAFDWSNITAQISIPRAEIAPLAPFATNIIAPKGHFSIYLTSNKGILSGEATVFDAATRPLGQIGAVQALQARLKLVGDQIQLVSCSGLLGGTPVSLSGHVNWKKREPTTKLPYFELYFEGNSVPLARTADLILRTDAAIMLSNLKGGQPIVSGTAILQKSYFLSDLTLLVPPKLATPKNRPPYFSLETQPFANWQLNIDVRGNEFLRIQSTFFNGTVSADFKLGGTLEAPIAIGSAKIDSGIIQFPFGNVKVLQGEAGTTSGNPFHPQIFITGSARAYSYEIRMEVSGPADNPKIEFTSTPALASQQILLMLTTGELPPSQTGLSGQQRTGRVALFVGKTFLSRIGILKGDEERLVIHSGESLAQPDIQAYTLEYKLNDEWSIVGDYDQYGGLNVGGKWRFFSK